MPTLSIKDALAHALDRHRAGRLLDAEKVYRQILADQPKHADALHLLGMLLHQSGKSDAAIPLIEQAISVTPNQPVFHSNLGLVLSATGQWLPAIAAYRWSLDLKQDSPQAMNNLGTALHVIGQTGEAVIWLERALMIQPTYTEARTNLAHLLMLQGNSAAAEKQPDEALRHFQRSVELNPNDAESQHFLGSLLHETRQSTAAIGPLRKSLELCPTSAHTHNNLGNVLFSLGSQDDAIACYRRALELKTDFPEASNNLGNVLKMQGRIEEAIAAYSRSVLLQPKAPEPYSNLGNLLREAGQRDLAIQSYQAALAIDPVHAQTLNNLANAYSEIGDWDRAIEGYRQALRSQPAYADAMNNLGTALQEIGRRDEAMELYRRALALQPEAVSAPWNIALLELLRGEYETGWPGYEHRWRQDKQKRTYRNFKQPMLPPSQRPRYREDPDGASNQPKNPALRSPSETGLAGKRVLLHAEQGFGDAIQFCRYASMVAELGARVLLECEPALARLFSSLAGVAEVIPAHSPLPEFDSQCPLMSLPMVFSTTLETVPAKIPYLSAEPSDVQQWGERFAAEPAGLRVGLAWAGGSNHQKDRHRSLKLADFAAIGRTPNVNFYSLQLGEPAAQAASPPAGMRLVSWAEHLHDFADTAAMLSHLDLVITVDTSVGHLAGALGKPVWTLLAYHPDWRWLLDREDSPWYPKTRLFRQKSPKDWTDPLARVAGELKRLSRSLRSPI